MRNKISLIVLLILLSFYLFNLFSQNKNKTLVSAQSITTTPACTKKTQGDANCDGSINDGDYTVWKCEFLGGGSCSNPSSTKTADFNLDTKVNLVDFEIWRKNRFASTLTATNTPTNTPAPNVSPTPTTSQTLTPTPTPTITNCSVCGLSAQKYCSRTCTMAGGSCTYIQTTCGNNTQCWRIRCNTGGYELDRSNF
jgi:hypothetical protein